MIVTKEILRTFANELNNRMEDKGVTYRHVALAARVPKANVYNYKSGTAFPELYSLVLMADYLDCSVDELLGYVGDRDSRQRQILTDNDITTEDEFADYFRGCLCDYMNRNFIDTKELARRSGVSTNTIDMYLSVHRWVPRTAEFIRLCDGLGCTPSELLGY